MTLPFPEPTRPAASNTEVFLTYLDYFRSVLINKVDGLDQRQLRSSLLPSGWTPIELAKHLTYVERRWLVWGFEGQPVEQPWGDARDGRWYVGEDEAAADVVAALRAQGEVTRAIVQAHDVSDLGQPGERWAGGEPATLERVLFHLLQEYARHVGHLDVVRELIDGQVGE